jgi:hypothetical protein
LNGPSTLRAARAIDASAAAAPDDFVSIAGGLAPSDDRTLFTRRVCCAAGAATRGGGGGGKVLKDRRSPRERGRTGTSVKIERASGRPALLVSGTSWTKDEDFGVLLDALAMYDEIARADAEELLAGGRGGELLSRGREGGDRGRGKSAPRGGNQKDENETRRKRRLYPDVVAIVTGKGPGRDAYERRMASLRLTHVAIRTAWLPIEDYPTLLGAADLGVCLHASSGGVDLPMKGASHTLVPIRPRSRSERRSLRTFAVISLRPPLAAFNPRPRRLITPTDAFQLHPDTRSSL